MSEENILNKAKEAVQSKKKRKWSASFRLFIIGILILLFIIPSSLVSKLISERANRKENTVAEVSGKWGSEQVINGPVLVLPYSSRYLEPSQRTAAVRPEYAYFLPDELDIQGDIKSEVRSRGIYDVPTYNGNFKIKGAFLNLDLASVNIRSDQIWWDQAFVLFGIADMMGVQDRLTINWNNKDYNFVAASHKKVIENGVQADVGMFNPEESNIKEYKFTFDLSLKGTNELFILPVGKKTDAKLVSDWPSPSFDGAFLPKQRSVTDDGFEASWTVLDLNRSFPQQWTSQDSIQLTPQIPQDNFSYSIYRPIAKSQYTHGVFGVKFFLPVDIYQKTTRSAKYAMAVILLVFVVFYMIEMIAKRRVHPLQYLLIGFALVVFYTLLLSMSEYIGFGLAYLIASIAIVAMITLFAKSVLKTWKLGLMNGGILAFLYIFIYVLLQMEDYTLLLGSIALFIILGILMYVSRYIKWYGNDA